MKVADLHPAIPNKFTENSLITNAKMVLVMTQVFCMVPISGILSNDLQAISMPRFSIKIFLFIAVMASVLCMSAAYSVVFVRYDCRLRAAEYVVFYTVALVLYITFLKIASKWKYLVRNWYEMDTICRKYCAKIKISVWQNALIISSIMLTAIEYVLYVYWHVTRAKAYTGGKFLVQFYLGALNSDIYVCCGFYYNRYLFVCGQIASFFASFSILTANLFIVTTALLITKYLNGFQWYLKNRLILLRDDKAEVNPVLQRKYEDEWRAIRIDYNRVSSLFESFDDNVSVITCVCVVYEALFVLFYFLHILKRMDPPLNMYSSYCSLACLSFQMLLLLFAAAGVYDSSCKLSDLMYKTAPKLYNQEIEHLMWKTTLGKTRLTLAGLYTVNRNTILNIFGTIITYELFALQMKNDSTEAD